jgi:pimeloyl-ACP methyl ester carboxylesterase
MDSYYMTESAEMTSRESYIARRRAIEGKFRRKELNEEVIAGDANARTRVLTGIFIVPEELKRTREQEPNALTRVSVYFPGIWELAKPNTGNTGEVNLLNDILLGDTDVIVVAKGEGLNNEAYSSIDAEGKKKGEGQHKVASAVAESLRRQLMELYQSIQRTNDGSKPQFIFTLEGYSEGATQAVSTALELQKFAKVKNVTAIAPAGLVGSDDQENVNLTDTVKKVIKNAFSKPNRIPSFPQNLVFTDENGQVKAGDNRYHQVTGDTFFIDSRLVGSKIKAAIPDENGNFKKAKIIQGFEGSLGDPAEIKPFDDAINVGEFFRRLLRTEGRKCAGCYGEDSTDSVPSERVKAALTKNEDYDALVKSGVNLTVVAGTQDGFFPFRTINNAVKELRGKNLNRHIRLIAVVNGTHMTFHYNPNGAAFMTKMAEELLGTTK